MPGARDANKGQGSDTGRLFHDAAHPRVGVAFLFKNPPSGAPVPRPAAAGWYLFLERTQFRALFAADVSADAAAFMAHSQVPAAHARTVRAADTDWKKIDHLYSLLEMLQPSPVVTLNRSVAVAKVHGPASALALIKPLGDRLARYFHFHGVKGALLAQLGRPDEARAAFDRAIALARTPAEAVHIRMQLDICSDP